MKVKLACVNRPSHLKHVLANGLNKRPNPGRDRSHLEARPISATGQALSQIMISDEFARSSDLPHFIEQTLKFHRIVSKLYRDTSNTIKVLSKLHQGLLLNDHGNSLVIRSGLHTLLDPIDYLQDPTSKNDYSPRCQA